MLFGDAFHNLVDGVVITSAFLMNIPLGIATALAVIAHEVPQEIGDFGILLDSGFSKQKALLYNFLSSMTTLFGAIIAYFYLRTTQKAIPYILALSAASFIYIALADLIPSLHKRVGLNASIRQFILLLAGVGTILFFKLQHG
ncbi:MAG: ZIP family metal transporter [Planctomycetes bacterium]|nr:ZIP family metal transporter [Planctomycetota bacterium]